MNPLFHTEFSISDSLKNVRKNVLIYETIITYLEYLLMYMPDTDWRNDLEELDYLMPWAEAVQAECKR